MLDDLIIALDDTVSDIVIQLDQPDDLSLEFDNPTFVPVMGEIYEGPYDVDPVFYNDQILKTAHRQMTRDVLVRQIRVVESTNPSGGKTVVIG